MNMKKVPHLDLVCGSCGRNLAQVIHDPMNTEFTPDGLTVYARPNVKFTDHRHWDTDKTANWKSHTYAWACKCGASLTRRHEWVAQEWKRFVDGQHGVGSRRVLMI